MIYKDNMVEFFMKEKKFLKHKAPLFFLNWSKLFLAYNYLWTNYLHDSRTISFIRKYIFKLRIPKISNWTELKNQTKGILWYADQLINRLSIILWGVFKWDITGSLSSDSLTCLEDVLFWSSCNMKLY